MYIGNTPDEKKASMEELTKRARKFGNIFKIIGILYGILMILAAFMMEGSIWNKLYLILVAVVSPIILYACGFIWYWGFITVKSWFVKYDISAGSLASAAGTSLAVSYLIGGKKSAKISLSIMIVIMCVVLTIGWWVGLFQYFSLKKETTSLSA